jgi:hypothetical protein
LGPRRPNDAKRETGGRAAGGAPSRLRLVPSTPPPRPPPCSYPFCHTGAVGGQDAAPYTRALGVGAPIPDPDTNAGQASLDCSPGKGLYTASVQAMGPHAAPLGMRFYRWKK